MANSGSRERLSLEVEKQLFAQTFEASERSRVLALLFDWMIQIGNLSGGQRRFTSTVIAFTYFFFVMYIDISSIKSNLLCSVFIRCSHFPHTKQSRD